jgi:hypothetical protein
MQKLCNPALVYIAIEIIVFILDLFLRTSGIWQVLIHLIFVVIWVCILQFVYYTLGWQTFSWILVLFPIVISVLIILYCLNNLAETKVEAEPTVSTFCVGSADFSYY